MKFTDLFIRRPVVATVVNLIILFVGLQSYKALTVRQYPKSDIAVIEVKTRYIGANADLVRGYVTTPLERVIASSDGIDYLESSSSQGLSLIKVHLKLNYDSNAALTQVQSKLAQVRNDLPPEAEAPTLELQMSDTQFAQCYLSFSSPNLSPSQVTDYLTRVVQPRLSAISGVQKADILGARTFAMRIWLKPDRMAALNLAPTEVRNALAANNYLAAIGSTKGSMTSINLIANTDLRSAPEFAELVLRERNGAIVRLKDVADVELGAEDYDSDVRFGGKKAVFMGVWVLPTANSLDVIKAVRDEVPALQKQLPEGMELGVPYDATSYIRDAIKEVFHTLTETLLIVVVVIFLFLGSMRAILIPVVAIPISLIGAVFLMQAFGFTINLLTLLAVVLSVGLVVDDAIVVVENVERHLHDGLTPFRAALKAGRELVGPIIAMTITLAAVYAPIGLQGGLTGTLFREFAFTLAGAVLISGVVALTLSPMMASKLLRTGDTHRGFAGFVNRQFDRLRNGYERRLTATLHWRPVVYTAAVLVMVLLVPFWMFSQKELAPTEDQGFIQGIVFASPNSTIEQTSAYAEKVNEIYQSMPETRHTFQITTPPFSFSGIGLKPWSERKRKASEIYFDLKPKLESLPGVQVLAKQPDPLPGGGTFPLELVVTTTAEPLELKYYIEQLLAVTRTPENLKSTFAFAQTDLKYDMPQTEIVFDRDKVATLGLNLQKVGLDLATLLGGNYVNRFSMLGRSYRVIPEAQRGTRLNPDQLNDFYVSGPPGANGQSDSLVKLSTFASLRNTVEPREVLRFQQLNSARIQGAFHPPATLDSALKILEDAAAKLPKGYNVDYAGESRQLRVEGNKLTTTLFLSLVLIYLVLAAQFESFRDPLIVLLGSVPLALTGALLFVFLGKTSVNIYSQVGLITLVGLVSKNGILIVEFANKLQEQGKDKFHAVVEAAGTRLRPILMTSVATVVGHFPLVLASGPGAAARNSIGIVLVTGMIIGTGFTLFVVPAIYMLIARNHQRDARPEEEIEVCVEEDDTELEPAGV
ncbi:MAG TPA: efflux RND transporter permease subunit [Chthoniobacteraceae bacterium]|jgi:multidrug efflux pump|nr:efflux RND transporter permease subunit [Chthoniobacteraceae bacterium]